MENCFPPGHNLVVVTGIQNGDEGKGRITQIFVPDSEIVCRPNAGSNAQHKVNWKGKEINFRHIPVGALNPRCKNILGAGMVINPIELTNELYMLDQNSITTENIDISEQVHLVFPVYRLLNRVNELQRSENKFWKDGSYKIGSGAQGYGSAMEFKASKKGVRLCDFIKLTSDEIEILKSRIQILIFNNCEAFIDYYKNVQINEIYDTNYHDKRKEVLELNVIRTYGEEMTRILVMGLYEKNKIAIKNIEKIHSLRNEVQKFTYGSDWKMIAYESKLLVREIYGWDIDTNKLFFEAATNYTVISKAISLFKTKIRRNTPQDLRKAYKENVKILFEGAQGTSLDVTHGLYPNAASGSATVPGMLADSGIGLPNIYAVGVCKPYLTTTSTASTILPTQLTEKEKDSEDMIRKTGNEGNRRICWLDIPMLKNNIEINGIATLAITHVDSFTGCREIKICTSYVDQEGKNASFSTNRKRLKEINPIYITIPSWSDDIRDIKIYSKLPREAQNLIEIIANLSGISVSFLTVGPDENQTIFCNVLPKVIATPEQ